ncbi:hypothetical protein HZC31_04965 [Candidatus Woesearchaeota archaeon]|nr:hypothetical protein [Candidatus Woesearchaeota archaeon]
MHFNRFFSIFVLFLLLLPFSVGLGLDPITYTEFLVDEWTTRETGADDDEDDIATIGTDECYVTCTDPNTDIEYTLRAEITATVFDNTNDHTTSRWYLEYVDSNNDEPVEVYYFNKNSDYEDEGSHRRTAQLRFFPWYEYDSVFGSNLMKSFTAYGAVGLTPFFPLIFQSDSTFSINGEGNWITHHYHHAIDYNACSGKYIEIDACADDGRNSCDGYSNTAVVTCYIFGSDETDRDDNNDGVIVIRGVDTEEDTIDDSATSDY